MMSHPSESPDANRASRDPQLFSHGWITWDTARSTVEPASESKEPDSESRISGALWHGPNGLNCRAELPDKWPFTSRMHAWGNGRMWRILGDPRSNQVLVTELVVAGDKRGEAVLATSVGEVSVTCEDGTSVKLQRWQVRRKTPQAVDAAIEFLGPVESERGSSTSDPAQA